MVFGCLSKASVASQVGTSLCWLHTYAHCLCSSRASRDCNCVLFGIDIDGLMSTCETSESLRSLHCQPDQRAECRQARATHSCHCNPYAQVDLAIVSAHALCLLGGDGKIRAQKQLDYSPMCATTYPAPSQASNGVREHLVVGSQVGVALIYGAMELLWSAKLTHPACSMAVGSFAGQSGLLLSMGSNGAISISYMGADPPTSAVASDAKVCSLHIELRDA